MTEIRPPENAGVIASPPLLVLAMILAGLGLQVLLPLGLPVPWPLGAGLVGASFVVFVFSLREFRRARTPVRPHHPTTSIITAGPYRFSRNPIYLSLVGLQLGLALWLGNAWLLITLAGTLALLRFGVIAREERYLERTLREDYLRYKASVRRWI